MYGKTRLTLCIALLLWSSAVQTAEGSYEDVITKLDNLLYRVVMSEVNIKERLEETEGQLKKTLEQLDNLMEHQNGLVQNDDQLLAKIDELREEIVQSQEIMREEFSSTLTSMGQAASQEFNELRYNMEERFARVDDRLVHLMEKQGELAADHEVIASKLIEMEHNAVEKLVMTLGNISHRFDKTDELVEEVRQNQEIFRVELSSQLISVKQDLNNIFNSVMSNVIEGFENADNLFDRLMQTQADLVTGHEDLTSAVTKMSQHISEQFVVILSNITEHFDNTNDQIENLAKNQDNSRLELSSTLSNMEQNMNNNFNGILSTINEGFSKTDVTFDRLSQQQDNIETNQQALTVTVTVTKMGNDMNDMFTKIFTNINDRSDRLEDQHRTTKDQLDLLLQNLDNHRVEFATVLTRIEQSTNQNFITVTNYAVQILQQQASCSTPQQPPVVTSCKNTPTKTSGQYQLKPFGTDEVLVGFCEQEKFGGGWLVMQHRFDGSVDFHRNWNDYKNGFGSIGGEFWLGLDKIHRLTSNKNVELIVELKDFNNNYIYARYDVFEIGIFQWNYLEGNTFQITCKYQPVL